MKRSIFGLLGCAFALLTTCLRVTEDRTIRDEAVGKASTGDGTFEVVDGLASVQKLEPGLFALWANAPSLTVHARRPPAAPAAWTFALENVLPDAVLEAATATGEPITVTLATQDRPTRQEWTLLLPADVDVTATLRSPRDGAPGVFRFALLSDIQEAIDRVQDIYARMNADPNIEFVVSAGDLTMQGAPEQLQRFQQELHTLRVPYFATLGNHELGTGGGEPFQRYFGRANFRFVHRGMQFTFIDSGSATLDPRVYDWLSGWLDEGRDRVHAVLMHIPPLDPVGSRNGAFADRDEAAKLLAMLAGGGVDLTLYGHIHTYYAFQNAGMPAFISGGGGAIPERFDGIGRHFLTVDVDPQRGELQTAIVRIDDD
jgi:predicted phosphodiesterase